MSQVPASGLPIGTILVYNATIGTTVFSDTSPQDLIAGILDDLESTWDLQIVGSSYSQPGILVLGDASIQLQLQMLGPNTYAQPDDVRSIVDGEINNFLGKTYITSSNISSFTLPPDQSGAAITQATGAPANNPTAPSWSQSLLSQLGLYSPQQNSNASSGALTGGASSPLSLPSLNVSTELIIALVVIVGIAALAIFFRPDLPGRIAEAF